MLGWAMLPGMVPGMVAGMCAGMCADMRAAGGIAAGVAVDHLRSHVRGWRRQRGLAPSQRWFQAGAAARAPAPRRYTSSRPL